VSRTCPLTVQQQRLLALRRSCELPVGKDGAFMRVYHPVWLQIASGQLALCEDLHPKRYASVRGLHRRQIVNSPSNCPDSDALTCRSYSGMAPVKTSCGGYKACFWQHDWDLQRNCDIEIQLAPHLRLYILPMNLHVCAFAVPSPLAEASSASPQSLYLCLINGVRLVGIRPKLIPSLSSRPERRIHV
jgi:hypothetical protein